MLNAKDLTTSCYRFGDVIVDRENFVVKKGDELRSLTPRAFDVLVYLIEQRGRVVEKQEIFEEIWKESFVTDNALSRSIKEIRRTIGDDPKEAKYIETVHKRGYKFIAEVEARNGHEEIKNREEAEEDSEGAKSNSSDDATTLIPASPVIANNATHTASTSRRLISPKAAVFTVAFCLFLTVAIIVWAINKKPAATETARPLKITRITTWSGLDVNPTLSPDGSVLAYSSDHNGNFEIYVKPLAPGSREIQITSDGEQNFDPAWSPDGKLIAYYSMKRGGIWLVPAFGGAAKQLTSFGSRPAWSSDGRLIAFHSLASPNLGAAPIGASNIWIVEAQNGAPKQLTRVGNPTGGHVSPTWSPDGKRIAFISADQTSSQLWSISIAGDDLKQITQRYTAPKADPVYAPDGKSIYFAAGKMLWKQPLAVPGGEPLGDAIKIADMGDASIRHLSIAANGESLAYSAWTSVGNLYSVPISPKTNESSGTPVSLTSGRGMEFYTPAFSPDGKRIAFAAEQRGVNIDVWLMDVDGSNAKQLTTSPALAHPPNRFPNWFPAGDRIAFLSRRQEQRKLWSIAIDGGKEEPLIDLTDEIEIPRLSPNGKQIAFNFTKDGIINIGTRNLDGGQLKQLTFDKELAGFPCWSPDGQFLAFQVKRGDDTHIAMIPSGGGEPMQLTFDKGQSWAGSWSPDGDKIAFAGARDGIWNVRWVSRSDKTERQLTQYAKLNSYVRRPAWSPLGTQIVYEYVETTGNIYIVDLK